MAGPSARRKRHSSGSRRRWRREAAWAVAAASVALVAAIGALRFWHATAGQPLAYSGDARLYAAVVVQGTTEDGWYLENGRLGAPHGQKLYDYPFENAAPVDVTVVGTLGRAIGDTFTAMNVFFLLGYAAVALSAFLVLRRLRLSRPAALVCSVLFSLLPYHFYRGEPHLFLAAYYAVPVGAYLVLRVLAGPGGLPRSRRSLLALLALCLVVGTGGVYYAGFTLVLLVAAGIVAAAARRRLGPLVAGFVPAAAIAFVLFVEHLPAIVYRAAHGGTSAASRRGVETEIYSLKLADLVFPLESHRLSFLGDVTRRYKSETVLPSEAGATLGTLGTLALVLLLGVVATAVVGPARLRVRRPAVRAAGVAALLALLLGTTGGVATVLAYTTTPQLRAWSRIAIFIGFFALFGLGVALDRVRAILRARRRPPIVAAAVLAAVLAIGLADQTSDAFIPSYGFVSEEFGRDRTFVRAVEARLPPGAAVFQLPYVPFPESNDVVPPRMVVYDQLEGVLHSKRLRWSFGAVKNGPDDWSAALAPHPMQEVLPAVATAGFAGVEVDRFGYPDDAVALERTLRQILRVRPLVGSKRRRAFYDLRPYAAVVARRLPPALRAELRTATLSPPRAVWGGDFYRQERDNYSTWRWSRHPSGGLVLDNPAPVAQRVVVSFRLATIGAPARTTIQWPDGRALVLSVGQREIGVKRTIAVPPGRSRIGFETAAKTAIAGPGDLRKGLFLRFFDLGLVPTVLERAARRAERP